MTILERIEGATVAPHSILAPTDHQVLRYHYQEYAKIRQHLMAALNDFELRLEKVKYPSQVVEHKGHYEVKQHPQRTEYYAFMYDVAQDIATVKNKLAALNQRYTSRVADHLNSHYNLALCFEDYGTQLISDTTLEEAVQQQAEGLALCQIGTERLKASFSERVYRPVKIKNNVVQLEYFVCIQEGIIRGYRIDYSERDKMYDLFKALSFFENERVSEIMEALRVIPGYNYNNDVEIKEYRLAGCQTIQRIRFYKNRRLDLRFASNDQARRFVQTFRLPLA